MAYPDERERGSYETVVHQKEAPAKNTEYKSIARDAYVGVRYIKNGPRGCDGIGPTTVVQRHSPHVFDASHTLVEPRKGSKTARRASEIFGVSQNDGEDAATSPYVHRRRDYVRDAVQKPKTSERVV